MLDSLNLSLADVGLIVLTCVLSVVVSIALASFVLVRLPHDYFKGDEPPSFLKDRPAWQRVAARIGKNLLGIVLIVLGVALSLPGVPGQGVLTILIGLTLVDFPGKRRLEQRIMAVPSIFRGANKIRARFDKAPFLLDEPVSA